MGAGNHAHQRACVVSAFTGTDLTDSLAKLAAEVALPADGSDRGPGMSIKQDPDGDRLNRCPRWWRLTFSQLLQVLQTGAGTGTV